MFLTPVTLPAKERNQTSQVMPFHPTDDRRPATFVTHCRHAVLMLDRLQSHVTEMRSDLIGANAPCS